MNVSIAAQTLSASVATAIDFLQDEIDHPEFQGSEASTDFIRKVDQAFDLMNSRNPFTQHISLTIELVEKWIICLLC